MVFLFLKKINDFMFDKSYFNGNGSGYKHGYESLKNKSRWKPFAKEILRFKNNGKALDIGCAFGFFLKYLPNFEKYGIDISIYAIERAKAIPKVKFFVHSIENKTNFKKNYFDVITAFDVLEHLNNLSNALAEIRRLLKKDGILLFTFPNTDCLIGKLEFLSDKSHKNDAKELKREIKKHFKIIEEKYVLHLGNSYPIVSLKLPNFLRPNCFIIAKAKH